MATSPHDIEGMIDRVAEGDRDALLALYDATSAKLFGVCLHVLHDRADAEEVLQEVFVGIWRDAGRYAANGLSPMTWLITMARNASIDRLRARRRAGETVEVPGRSASPDASRVASSEARRIAACLRELERGRADAVRGAYLQGLSYRELAARHGVPLNTMRTWLRRSLLKLKECLSR